jgi:GxxExxY protein
MEEGEGLENKKVLFLEGRRMYEGEQLTQQVIECLIEVHKTLGPGFIESVYHNAMILELNARGMAVETEKPINVFYKGKIVGNQKLDIVVEGRVVLELKVVEALSKAHYAQLRSYLKASNLPIGLLVNFADAKADFRRVEI